MQGKSVVPMELSLPAIVVPCNTMAVWHVGYVEHREESCWSSTQLAVSRGRVCCGALYVEKPEKGSANTSRRRTPTSMIAWRLGYISNPVLLVLYSCTACM